MRIPKEISAWFDVPNDPDKSRFKFKLLNPGEISEVQDAAFDMTVEFGEDGTGKRLGRPTTTAGREKEVFLSLQKWERVYDFDGKELEYSIGNKLKPMRNCSNFYEFYLDCAKKLQKMKEEREKNSKSTSKD